MDAAKVQLHCHPARRRHGFYVDPGAIFDLGDLRPFASAHNLFGLGSYPTNSPGVNSAKDLNVHLTTPGAALRSKEHAGSKDNLILDIGADVGALAIYTAADRDGTEIEISPAGDHRARSRNAVYPRTTRSAIRYAAVFPALAAGDYTVWRDETTPAGTITIHGGEVTRFHLGSAPR